MEDVCVTCAMCGFSQSISRLKNYYCRFQVAFQNKVPKFVTNVRNYIIKLRNWGRYLGSQV